jgi:hypothetical protein
MGFNSLFNGHFYSMAAHDGALYLGTWDWSENLQGTVLGGFAKRQFGFDLFKTTDGTSWSVVTRNGIDDPSSFAIRNMVSTPFGLFVGAANQWLGLQIYQHSGVLDLNHDGAIDIADVDVILAAKSSGAIGDNDPRDVNRDGRITSQDARKLETQCSNPQCAPNAHLGARAPASLAALPEDVTPSTIKLSWAPVPGAVRYHVFRADAATLDNLLPPTTAITVGSLVVTVEQIRNGVLDSTCHGSVDEISFCAAVQALQSTTLMMQTPHWIGATNTLTFTTARSPAALYHVAAEDAAGQISAPSNVVPSP